MQGGGAWHSVQYSAGGSEDIQVSGRIERKGQQVKTETGFLAGLEASSSWYSTSLLVGSEQTPHPGWVGIPHSLSAEECAAGSQANAARARGLE